MAFLATFLSITSWILVALPVLLLFIFTLEVSAGLAKNRDAGETESSSAEKPSRLTVLIPAHNEARIISKTVENILHELPEHAKILVVADNCTDDTAARARMAGADVIERTDTDRKGKGFALAFGRDALAHDPPDCVMVIDADCEMEQGSIQSLHLAALAKAAPVQAINLIRSRGASSSIVQISNFAMLIKNLVRQRGMTRMGGAALLTGTGMAFPWNIFAKAPLASADIAEDLALGASLTQRGVIPRFVESARIWSDAAAKEDTLVQRTRWEHGFMTTAKQYALPLIGTGLKDFSRPALGLGLHLLVPPLALLLAISFAIVFAVTCAALLGGSWVPSILLSASLVLALLVTFLAWQKEGRAFLTVAAMVRAPLYIVWKIPLYLKLLQGAEKKWVRTRRPGED